MTRPPQHPPQPSTEHPSQPPAPVAGDELKWRIARNLRRLRRERELTGLALARASGIAPSYIVKIERHGANLTIDVLERLAAALSVPVSDLQAATAPRTGALARTARAAELPAQEARRGLGQAANRASDPRA